MSLSFTVVSTPADRLVVDMLAVPIASGGVLGPGADAIDAALGGALVAFLNETGFDGTLGDTVTVPTPGGLRAKAAVLVGVGDPTELTLDGLRRIVMASSRYGPAMRSRSGISRLALSRSAARFGDSAQALAEGFTLGAYQFLEYKKDPKPTKLTKVSLIGEGGADVRAALARGHDRQRGGLGARHREPAIEGEATRRGRIGGAALAAGPRRLGAGTRRRAIARAATRRAARRRSRFRADAPVLEAVVHADRRSASRAGQDARVRRERGGVRLGWSVAEARGRHGDDEM